MRQQPLWVCGNVEASNPTSSCRRATNHRNIRSACSLGAELTLAGRTPCRRSVAHRQEFFSISLGGRAEFSAPLRVGPARQIRSQMLFDADPSDETTPPCSARLRQRTLCSRDRSRELILDPVQSEPTQFMIDRLRELSPSAVIESQQARPVVEEAPAASSGLALPSARSP